MRDTYWRRAVVLKVVDGDTVRVRIDDGRRMFSDDSLRLLGVNTPERKGATLQAGNAARDYVSNWLTEHRVHSDQVWPSDLRTEKSDSFDRWLADIECEGCGESLNAALLQSGHATPFPR